MSAITSDYTYLDLAHKIGPDSLAQQAYKRWKDISIAGVSICSGIVLTVALVAAIMIPGGIRPQLVAIVSGFTCGPLFVPSLLLGMIAVFKLYRMKHAKIEKKQFIDLLSKERTHLTEDLKKYIECSKKDSERLENKAKRFQPQSTENTHMQAVLSKEVTSLQSQIQTIQENLTLVQKRYESAFQALEKLTLANPQTN